MPRQCHSWFSHPNNQYVRWDWWKLQKRISNTLSRGNGLGTILSLFLHLKSLQRLLTSNALNFNIQSSLNDFLTSDPRKMYQISLSSVGYLYFLQF
jgi:hypothetical protein